MPRAHGCAAAVSNLDEPFDLNPYVEFIEDADQSISLQDIQAGKYADRWQLNTNRYFIGHNNQSRYWWRVALKWNGDSNLNGILYIKNQPGLIQHLTVMLPQNISVLQPQKNGALKPNQVTVGGLEPYHNRLLESNQYSFPISSTPGQYQTVVGWIDSSEIFLPSLLPLYLITEKKFEQWNNNNRGILIAFYSVMAALLLYNSCLFLTLRLPVYGYYLLFLAFITLACSYNDGSASHWIFPQNPQLLLQSNIASGIILSLTYISFLLNALDILSVWPQYKKICRLFLGGGIIGLLVVAIPDNIMYGFIFNQIYCMASLLIALFLIGGAIIKRIPTSGYLLIAEAMTLVGGTAYMLMFNGIVPINDFTFWGLHWGSLGEALLLSLAVAARTNIAIQEKLQAQKLAYQNERKALEALEAATQIKNQFLTTVSHELRTPLNSIIGFSSVLLDDHNIKGTHRDYTQTILNNGKQLLSVVNDVLNLSLIDSNRLTITERTLELAQLLRGLEVRYRITAQKKGLLFSVKLEEGLPQLIKIDDEHLSQILQQLLNNAFKFTHQGCVTLHVSALNPITRSDDDDATLLLLVSLTDTGIGISATQLTQVFEPFTQADGSNTRRYSGTGVGLFIAKSVCEKMGGSLSVESTMGVGTRFELIIPCSEVHGHKNSVSAEMRSEPLAETHQSIKQTQPTTILKKPSLHGRVLYAEDNLDNQQLLQMLVTTTGAEVTLAANGREAIDAVNSAESPFDLVLMDLQMPVMDGYEATAILQRNGCNTPIVACSASALADIVSSSDAVFAGYLGKPIDKMQLYAVLREYLATA